MAILSVRSKQLTSTTNSANFASPMSLRIPAQESSALAGRRGPVAPRHPVGTSTPRPTLACSTLTLAEPDARHRAFSSVPVYTRRTKEESREFHMWYKSESLRAERIAEEPESIEWASHQGCLVGTHLAPLLRSAAPDGPYATVRSSSRWLTGLRGARLPENLWRFRWPRKRLPYRTWVGATWGTRWLIPGHRSRRPRYQHG